MDGSGIVGRSLRTGRSDLYRVGGICVVGVSAVVWLGVGGTAEWREGWAT